MDKESGFAAGKEVESRAEQVEVSVQRCLDGSSRCRTKCAHEVTFDSDRSFGSRAFRGTAGTRVVAIAMLHPCLDVDEAIHAKAVEVLYRLVGCAIVSVAEEDIEWIIP